MSPISNRIAIKLSKKDVGRFMCTAGVGGHRPGLLKSAEGCDSIIVIDGCPVNCAKETLEHVAFPLTNIVLTELGIKKNKDLDIPESQIGEALSRVSKIL